MSVLLAIDLGTEGARVGAFDVGGECLGTAHEAYPTSFPRPGWAEQDPEDWWAATVRATRAVLAAPGVRGAGTVTAISVATTASTVVVLDGEGNVLRPAIMWMDSRASREAEETGLQAADHPVLAYSGGADAVEWLVPKAMWLARHEPQVYARAHRVVEAVDYLTWRLTGGWVASLMNATCKWNYDSVAGRYPTGLYQSLGIGDLVERLPEEVRAVGDPAGPLASGPATELGIDSSPVVAVGGIDAHVSLLACGEPDEGLVSVVGGTSTVFITETTSAVYSPAVWGPYPNALHRDRWLIEGGQVSSGSVLNWLAQGILNTPRDRLGELTAEAERIAPSEHGLLVLDYFMGNRTPHRDPRLRGAVLGLTLGTRPAELYRATVEAVCYGTRSVLDSWLDAGIPVGRIVLSGGIRHNPLWLTTTAEVLDRPLELVDTENLTLRSGAVQAAHAAGLFPTIAAASKAFAAQTRMVEPTQCHQKAYTTGYQRYLETTKELRGRLHELAEAAGGAT